MIERSTSSLFTSATSSHPRSSNSCMKRRREERETSIPSSPPLGLSRRSERGVKRKTRTDDGPQENEIIAFPKICIRSALKSTKRDGQKTSTRRRPPATEYATDRMEYFVGQKTIAGPPDRRTPSPCRRGRWKMKSCGCLSSLRSRPQRERTPRGQMSAPRHSRVESLRVRLQRAVYVLDHGLILTRRRRWRCSDRGAISLAYAYGILHAVLCRRDASKVITRK